MLATLLALSLAAPFTTTRDAVSVDRPVQAPRGLNVTQTGITRKRRSPMVFRGEGGQVNSVKGQRWGAAWLLVGYGTL